MCPLVKFCHLQPSDHVCRWAATLLVLTGVASLLRDEPEITPAVNRIEQYNECFVGAPRSMVQWLPDQLFYVRWMLTEFRDTHVEPLLFFKIHVVLAGIAKGGDKVNRKGKEKVHQIPENNQQCGGKEMVAKGSWRRPEEGWVKCNVDASFSDEERSGAWGAVLRDHMAGSLSRLGTLFLNATMQRYREAIACLEGLKLALAYSASNLVIETDCAAVLETFKADNLDRSETSVIAKEFRLKKPPDRQVMLAKISRVYNAVAHELCRFGRRELRGGVFTKLGSDLRVGGFE